MRCFLPFAIALARASAASLSSSICEIENGFDYVGQDVANVANTPIEMCCSACQYYSDKGCNVWTWTNYKNGTCWLKSKVESIVVNRDAKSARKVYAPEGSDSCFIYADVDFEGNDIANKHAPKVQDCCQICKSTLGCRAYSWNDYQGGTCWLKSTAGTHIVRKPGVKSAEAYPSGYPYRRPLYPVEAGVDFVGNDIANAPADDPSKCGELCYNLQGGGCKAFSWNKYQGGTCWFKSKKDATKVNAGVTSAALEMPVAP